MAAVGVLPAFGLAVVTALCERCCRREFPDAAEYVAEFPVDTFAEDLAAGWIGPVAVLAAGGPFEARLRAGCAAYGVPAVALAVDALPDSAGFATAVATALRALEASPR